MRIVTLVVNYILLVFAVLVLIGTLVKVDDDFAAGIFCFFLMSIPSIISIIFAHTVRIAGEPSKQELLKKIAELEAKKSTETPVQ